MSVLDVILIVLLLFGVIRGFMRGLFVELASLVALVAGVYGAIHFSNYAATFLKSHVDWEPKYITITAFAVTFVIIVLVISLAGKALTKLADFAMLGILNKLLGAAFAFLKGLLILSILLLIIEKLNNSITILSEENKEESQLYAPIKSLVPMIFPSFFTDEDDSQESESLIENEVI